MEEINEQTLKEEEKKYSEMEKELIDDLVNNYDELSDDYIRATLMKLHARRVLIKTERLLLEITKMVND